MLSQSAQPTNRQTVPPILPLQEIYSAMRWQGFLSVSAYILELAPEWTLYKMIIRDAASYPPVYVFQAIQGAFCEKVKIPSLWVKGDDIHLHLEVSKPV